jgi:hypothetical protein
MDQLLALLEQECEAVAHGSRRAERRSAGSRCSPVL